jgi:hypothetical protein
MLTSESAALMIFSEVPLRLAVNLPVVRSNNPASFVARIIPPAPELFVM